MIKKSEEIIIEFIILKLIFFDIYRMWISISQSMYSKVSFVN